MTLIEVLIATALTLLIMLALAQGFKTLSDGVTAGRARLTGSDQLRSISSLLRSDLSGMTANVRNLPQTQQAAMGYFMYYDGPLSDSTAMLYNYLPNATTPEEQLSASRWSDIDDVLMFTAKAKDGQWFRGRVPLGLLRIHQRNLIGNSAPLPTVQDWLTDVSIASEYAEIAWFMRPLNPIGGIDFTGPNMVNTPVYDDAPGVDRTGDGIPDPDGMPDRVALCRRVLLIRPDLNITPDASLNLQNDLQLCCQPQAVNNGDSFRFQMQFPYQRCDLSVRPIFDTNRFVLRTNSLADLQIPENRFAHAIRPIDHPVFGPASSLPMLSLTTEGGAYLDMINLAYGQIAPSGGASLTPPFDHGFIPSLFFRTRINADSNGNVVSLTPTLEEVVASNVVGFDVRGYDGMVQQLSSPGGDGQWGAALIDDDGLNGVDDSGEAGWPGTDDLVVGPSDPGYAVQIASGALAVANSGAFVDLCWARRVVNQIDGALTRNKPLNGINFFAPAVFPSNHPTRALWSTPLSGLDPLTGGGPLSTLNSMIKAGKFNIDSGVYQPSFDTFTDFYEADGNRQDFGISANGLVRFGGPASTNNPSPDQGIDGLDNNANGAVDEDLEAETSPPIAYPMPAIQVKIRVQDVPAGTLQELSIVHDLIRK